jgi:hypothetical protein
MPLVDALHLCATQWSRRLGHDVYVYSVPNGGGYRIGCVNHRTLHPHHTETETRAA